MSDLPGSVPGVARDVGSVWTVPGMPALAVLSVLGFTGYAALFPVVPLWVVAGGSGTAGAGLVNGVMLAATVATQGFIPMLLAIGGFLMSRVVNQFNYTLADTHSGLRITRGLTSLRSQTMPPSGA